MSLYERYTWRGETFDRMTIAALLAVDKRLGYEQTIIQGSYNRGVGASAGTHDGGGAVDIVWFDIKRKLHAFRDVGWAFWPRPTLPGEWSAHGHGILIGNEKADDSAKRQVDSYKRGRNGLASDGVDPYQYRPDPIRAFSYERSALVSWKRLNEIARHPKGAAFTPSGAREVEVVAWALKGFGMSITGHKRGRMDAPILRALGRFRDIRNVDPQIDAPMNPTTAYELCIPTLEDK